MKTNELVKIIEDLGLEADFDYVWIGEEEYEVLSAYYDGDEALRVSLDWFGEWFVFESVFEELDPNKRHKLLDAFIDFAHTSFPDREEGKRYIIPLPELVTTDGEQQYLTQKGKHWFAGRRNEELRQTWKEEHLKYVPELYRGFKVEVEDGIV